MSGSVINLAIAQSWKDLFEFDITGGVLYHSDVEINGLSAQDVADAFKVLYRATSKMYGRTLAKEAIMRVPQYMYSNGYHSSDKGRSQLYKTTYDLYTDFGPTALAAIEGHESKSDDCPDPFKKDSVKAYSAKNKKVIAKIFALIKEHRVKAKMEELRYGPEDEDFVSDLLSVQKDVLKRIVDITGSFKWRHFCLAYNSVSGNWDPDASSWKVSKTMLLRIFSPRISAIHLQNKAGGNQVKNIFAVSYLKYVDEEEYPVSDGYRFFGAHMAPQTPGKEKKNIRGALDEIFAGAATAKESGPAVNLGIGGGAALPKGGGTVESAVVSVGAGGAGAENVESKDSEG